MERETGFEPATPTLARSCSTAELFPRLLAPDARRILPRGTYGDSPRSAAAAASGGTGLMKNPLPHSNPATLASFGMISRCQ
jgi:hypothetical protein